MKHPIARSAASHPVRSPSGRLWHPRMGAYWPMDTWAGVDATGKGHAITLAGPQLVSVDGWRTATSFDGSDDSANAPLAAVPAAAGDATFTFRFRNTTSGSSNRWAFRIGQAGSTADANSLYDFMFRTSDGRVRCTRGNGSNSATLVVTNSDWLSGDHHAAVVYTSNEIRLYVDGELAGTQAHAISGTPVVSEFVLGGTGGLWWGGLLADFIVWPGLALSLPDIRRLDTGFAPEAI